MSADLKRVRASQDEGHPSPASKKRALTAGGSGGAVVSPTEEESGMEDWMRVVEVKRKEAIYRQMLEYRRSYETEARKVRELDEQRKRLEASVQAVEICWTQLVNAVRTLVPDTDGTDVASLEPILEPQIAEPALEEAIGTRLPATRQLINRFVTLASKNGSRVSSNELQERCLRLQAETSTLRSANQTLQSQLSASAESSDKYRSDLARAQKRLDKQRMDHDLAEQDWRASRDRDRERTDTPGQRPPANGTASGHATPNGRSDDVKPSLDRAAGMLQDTTELEQLADSRLKELLSLRSEHTALQIENDKLRQSTIHPSEESLRAAPFFQLYLQQISQQYARAEAFQQKFEAADNTLDKLRQDNHAFREAVIADCKVEVEQLRKQAHHRNSDLTRIRAERDEMSTELTGRKMQEESRFKWAEEMEGVVKSQEVRVGTMTSEVKRLRGMLGAEAGSRGYLNFLQKEGVDGDYVKSLEEQLSDAQGRMSALSQSSSTDDAKVQLEKAQRALAKYDRIFGSASEAPEDAVRLAQQLEAADKEKSALLLQLDQTKSSTNSVYTDLEALDKVTQSLQTQLQSKVFDLKDVDARMSRLTTEKAKADNRYFQTMRAREATEAECKAAQRTVDKQLKLLEKAREVEKALQGQITSYEKGLIAVKNEASSMQNQLATVTSERTQFEIRYQQSQTALQDAQAIMQQRVSEAATEKEIRIKLQEEVDKASTALKKLKDRQEHLLASSSSGAGTSAGELQMREERDKLLKLLRCSCCEQNFKTQVIVKCMHTFCKPCLDSRISSRQRKCPACGLSFAKEDVQTLYWQ